MSTTFSFNSFLHSGTDFFRLKSFSSDLTRRIPTNEERGKIYEGPAK